MEFPSFYERGIEGGEERGDKTRNIYQNVPVRLSRSNPNLRDVIGRDLGGCDVMNEAPDVIGRSYREYDGIGEAPDVIGRHYGGCDVMGHSPDLIGGGHAGHDVMTPSRHAIGHDFATEDRDVTPFSGGRHAPQSPTVDRTDRATPTVTFRNHRNEVRSAGSAVEWPYLTSLPTEFSAYASNTSLEHDSFTKTSKIYKWNGSCSVSDLTSLTRDLGEQGDDLSPPVTSRLTSSASDLSRIGVFSGGQVKVEGSGGMRGGQGAHDLTSYVDWRSKVNEDADEEDFDLMMPNGNFMRQSK